MFSDRVRRWSLLCERLPLFGSDDLLSSGFQWIQVHIPVPRVDWTLHNWNDRLEGASDEESGSSIRFRRGTMSSLLTCSSSSKTCKRIPNMSSLSRILEPLFYFDKHLPCGLWILSRLLVSSMLFIASVMGSTCLVCICLWSSFAYDLHVHMIFICIWSTCAYDLYLRSSFAYDLHVHMIFMCIWSSCAYDLHVHMIFICIWSSFAYDLHVHMIFICIWSLHVHMIFICIWSTCAYDLHLHMIFMCIWSSWPYDLHGHMIFMAIWSSFAYDLHLHMIFICIWSSFAYDLHLHMIWSSFSYENWHLVICIFVKSFKSNSCFYLISLFFILYIKSVLFKFFCNRFCMKWRIVAKCNFTVWSVIIVQCSICMLGPGKR